MPTPAFDSLSAARRLEAADMPRKQAEAVVATVVSAASIREGLATQESVAQLESTMATKESVEHLAAKVDTMATKESVDLLAAKVDTMATKESVEHLAADLAQVKSVMATKESVEHLAAAMATKEDFAFLAAQIKAMDSKFSDRLLRNTISTIAAVGGLLAIFRYVLS